MRLVLLLTAVALAQNAPANPSATMRELAGTKLRIHDREYLRARPDGKEHFPDKEPLLLPAIRDALDHPLDVSRKARALGAAVTRVRSLPLALKALQPYHRGGELAEPFAQVPPLEGVDELDPAIRFPVMDLHAAAHGLAMLMDQILKPLSEDERAHLRTWLPKWIGRTQPEDRERFKAGEEDIETRDALLRCAKLWSRIDEKRLRMGWAFLVARVDEAVGQLRKAKPFKQTVKLEGPGGPIVLGGHGNNRIDADAAIVIDFGGDDEYRISADAADRPVRIVIDLGGNDLYLSKKPFTWGAALLGLALHVDTGGDDDYRGPDWSLGCGVGGHAALWDRDGHDRYYGGLGSQGVGIFGTGLLLDDGGDDEYAAGCFCQGFGSTAGLGALIDLTGDDTYLAGRDEEDAWRRPGTYVTFAQGSGYSHRFGHVWTDENKKRRWKITGQIPGGVGVLIDGKGNDRYEADVFGQGSAYWYSLGLLVDGDGNDRYRATWYGQGVGTHAAVGCVVDVAGDDRYMSRNTSQGCGHDFSAGILHDLGGDDDYRGLGLCQGAGNAGSGLGVLIDERGDDRYRCGSRAWGFGSGYEPKPEIAPYGFLLDLGGTNRYEGWAAGNAVPGTRWKHGDRGFGVDGR